MSRSLRTRIGAFATVLFTSATLLLAGPAATTATAGAIAPATPGTLGYSFPDLPNGLIQKDVLEFEASPNGNSCDSNIVASDVTVTKNGSPTTDVTVTGMDVDAAFLVTIHPGAANAPGTTNEITITLTCLVSTVSTTFTSPFSWAQINVTKTVVGDGPAGALYPVSVACTPSLVNSLPSGVSPSIAAQPVTRTFDLAAAATGSVFLVTNGACTITETDSKGAVTSVVSPGTVTISSSTTQLVSVTNTFPEAPVTPRYTG